MDSFLNHPFNKYQNRTLSGTPKQKCMQNEAT